MTVDDSGALWRKSSRSGSQGGQCVEIADFGDVIAIRDSKNPDSPTLPFTRREMAEFTARVRSGQLDA